jgi:hypothetical protein
VQGQSLRFQSLQVEDLKGISGREPLQGERESKRTIEREKDLGVGGFWGEGGRGGEA